MSQIGWQGDTSHAEILSEEEGDEVCFLFHAENRRDVKYILGRRKTAATMTGRASRFLKRSGDWCWQLIMMLPMLGRLALFQHWSMNSSIQ